MNGKRMLQNLPFAVSGGVLLALWAAGNSKKAVLLCGVLALAAAVALGRAPVLGRWLRDRRDPLGAVCGALAAAWGGVLFADNWKFEGIAARLGLAPGMLVAVLAVAAVLAALPAAVALATWLLQRGGALEDRCRAVLESRPVFGILWLCGAALLALQAYFVVANPYIWQDEVFTLKLIRHPVGELVALTAVDVHPPLYYLIVKAFVTALPGVPAIPLAKLVSLLPYLLLWLGAGVAGWRRSGPVRLGAGVFALCLGGMPKLLDYGTEIRMYSWGLFFVTGGLLAAWYTARTGKVRGWVGLVIFGLLAAYTHYFACVAVAVAYLALLVWQLVRRDRRGLVRWGIAAAVTVAAYLPWLFVLLAQLRTVQGNYWIEPITLQSVQGYGTFLFGSGSLWVAVALVTVLWLTTCPRGADGLCVGAALLCPFWTIAVGLVASAVVRPVFVARYLVPELGCLWLGVAAALALLPRQRIKVVVLAVLLATAWGDTRAFVADQQYQASETRSTLAVLDTLPQDAKLVSTATRVQEKLAGLCERESYGWQVSPGELPKSVYDNLYDLTDAATLTQWVEAGRTVCFFEDAANAGAAQKAAQQAGLQARPLAECGLCEPLTVWEIVKK